MDQTAVAADASAASPRLEPPAEPEVPPREEPRDEPSGPTLQSAISVLTTLGPPVTLATALMIYFGWARTQEQARYMGLDGSLFGYTTQDYVMRSISTLFIPLLILAALGLGWLAAHTRIAAALRRPARGRMLRYVGRVMFYVGLAVAALSVLVVTLDRSRAPLVVPLALAGGTAVAAYGQWLAAAAGVRRGERPSNAAWLGALKTLVVGGIIALALFWELSAYAGVVGRGSALQIARSVDSLPRATVLSNAPLNITAQGVREERLPGGGAATGAAQYRTTGLRLMVRSGGRIFLLHDEWTPQRGTVIVLSDSAQLTWQFSR
ncbi:MAG TPA: hypothetical protein VHN18_17975 [Micromonosporaceae bacterium]|nr:hypothetical protein [Micromonosporaceae bacterium]